MKRLMFAIIAVCLIMAVAFLIQCRKKPEDEGEVINDKVRLPENNPNLSGVVVNGDTLLLMYYPGSSKPSFNSGDIVVGQANYGYLKRVASQSTSGDTIVLITEQASIVDAIERGSIESTFSISPQGQLINAIQIDSTVVRKKNREFRLQVASDEPKVTSHLQNFEIRIPNISLELRDMNDSIAVSLMIDTLVLSKDITIDFELNIRGGEVIHFFLAGTTDDGVDFRGVTIDLERCLVSEDWSILLYSQPLGKVGFMIGPVPVILVFYLNIYVGIEADLSVNLTTQIANNVSLSSENMVGAEYFLDGTWQPIFGWTLDGSANYNFSPGASVNASVNPYFKGEIDVLFYGVLGPRFYLKPYQYNIASYPPIDYELGVGLAAGVEFELSILDKGLIEFNYTFADYTMMLEHYQTTNNPPNIPSTPSGPSNGDVGVSYDFSSTTTDPDGDNISIRFSWGDGDTSSWGSYVSSGDTVQMQHAWNSEGNFLITSQAKDINGSLSGWSSGNPIVVSYGFPDSILQIIPTPSPSGVACIPNGNYVYVTNVQTDEVSVIRSSDNTIITTIPVGDAPVDAIALPNGDFVYVTNRQGNTVSVIRTSDNAVVSTIPVGNEPSGIIALPNNNYVYSTNISSNSVSVIRTSDNVVVSNIPVGNGPWGITCLPTGDYVYVTNGGSNSVSVIRTSDNSVVTNISVGTGPAGITSLPNGNLVYVANYGGDEISVINTTNNAVISSISLALGSMPIELSPLPSGDYVYVTLAYLNSVAVIRTSDNTLVKTIGVGDWPNDVAALPPNGSFLYVTNEGSNDVYVIGN